MNPYRANFWVIGLVVNSLLLFNSCQGQNSGNTFHYLSYGEFSEIDTITYQVINQDSTKDFFAIKLSSRFGEFDYLLPRNKDQVTNSTKLIQKKTYHLSGDQFIVYKYIIDDPKIADDELLIFYLPSYGIILKKYLAWDGYEKPILKANEAVISILIDKVFSDTDFFNEWR